MIISFSGLDGSGKTTQIDLITEHLEKKGINVRKRHAIKDSFAHFLLVGAVGKITPKGKEGLEKGLRQDKNKLKLRMLSFVKKTFLMLDIIYFRFRYSSYKKNKKNALICDRYFYDELVQLEYLKICGASFAGSYERLIVEPDVAFLLQAASDEAHRRKNEYDIEYFRVKGSLYENMQLKKKVFTVIPAGAIPVVQKTIEARIDQAFLKGDRA